MFTSDATIYRNFKLVTRFRNGNGQDVDIFHHRASSSGDRMNCQSNSDAPMTKFAWRLFASNLALRRPAAENFAFDSFESSFGNRSESACPSQPQRRTLKMLTQQFTV